MYHLCTPGIFPFSCPVEMGDEHWLYFSGTSCQHEFYCKDNWPPDEHWVDWQTRYGAPAVGFACWPKYRLFGFDCDRSGRFTIDLGTIDQPSELRLNYKTGPQGTIRVELLDVMGKNCEIRCLSAVIV